MTAVIDADLVCGAGDDGFKDRLATIWTETLEAEIERLTGKLSGMLLQIIFNIPVVSILGYCGWLTLQTFFEGSYLPSDFFMHAFWAIGIILVLQFFKSVSGDSPGSSNGPNAKLQNEKA